LESLNILSGWGVFPLPGNRTSSVISWDSVCVENVENMGKTALLSGRASGERDLEITAQIGERMSLRVSNERTTYSELRALLPSLSFLPSDANILDGSPSVRRLFMDKLCALSFPPYARRLAEYRQLTRQRTALLRRNVESSSLRASAQPIAQLGGWIRFVRKGIVDLLSEKLSHGDLPPDDGLLPFDVSVVMKPYDGNKCNGDTGDKRDGFGLEDHEDHENYENYENYVEDLRLALDAGLERERRAGVVLAGPHRDDLLFSCLGRPAALALSRGQKRRVVMAVILAAGRMIETKLRVKPILILDDAAAELDSNGRSLMGRALAATGWQVFASGVEDPFQTPDSAVWHVQDGKISG